MEIIILSFDENNLFRLKRIIIRYFLKMSKSRIIVIEVNNFTSVDFGHCGKSKNFVWTLEYAPLGIFFGSEAKCYKFSRFSTKPSNNKHAVY